MAATLGNLVSDGPNQISTESKSLPTTAGTDTTTVDVRDFEEITLYFHNTSDRSVTFQVLVAPSLQLSSLYHTAPSASITLAAGDSAATSSVAVLTDRHGVLKVNIKASGTNSTVGAATVGFLGHKVLGE